MFFDQKYDDQEYQRMLIGMAGKGREILACSYDIMTGKRVYMPPARRGLFGFGKKEKTLREIRLEEYEELRKQIIAYRKEQGYTGGLFWWSLPFDTIEEGLRHNLRKNEDIASWRFAYEEREEIKDGHHILGFFEEGHCSDFSVSTSYQNDILSSYSHAEIDRKMQEFENKMTTYDLAEYALINGPVHSVASGIDYDSMGEYLLSAEHFLERDYYRSQYARSLYTERETQVVSVQSNSTHYKSLYMIGEYHMDGNGRVDHIAADYRLLWKSGVGSGLVNYEECDAAVALAGRLEKNPAVKEVPLELFGGRIDKSNASYEEALRQAQIMICLADKIC